MIKIKPMFLFLLLHDEYFYSFKNFIQILLDLNHCIITSHGSESCLDLAGQVSLYSVSSGSHKGQLKFKGREHSPTTQWEVSMSPYRKSMWDEIC